LFWFCRKAKEDNKLSLKLVSSISLELQAANKNQQAK
jgi:hypothetical protein